MNPQLSAFLEEFYAGAGGEVDGCHLMLRYFGDDLDPVRITSLLKVQPTTSCRKGDCRLGKPAVFERTGVWLLDCGGGSETAENQIRALFAKLPANPDVWNELSLLYSAGIKIHLSLARWCRVTILSSDVIALIAERGLKLNLDIYAARPPTV